MEKPTGVIQKIIESLQQVNALDVYSSIEKDIILHNLRAAYMIFLNIPVKEESAENRVEKLFTTCDERKEVCGEEKEERKKEEEEINVETSCNSPMENVGVENLPPEEEIIEEQVEQYIEISDEEIIEEVIIDKQSEEVIEITETISVTNVAEKIETVIEIEEEAVEELNEVTIIEEVTIEEKIEIKIEEYPPKPILHDDILEFIPDAQLQSSILFEEKIITKSEKKSLNDLLTEKKEDQSLGTRFQHSSIPDLTKAIAINEKFTFIRELFRNSGVDFSNAIQKLNECENIDTAFTLMEELKHQYLWDTTSSTYLSLCDLVRRRFL